ncbi:hypothetical protein HK098_007805 [Nowakowskiella sp. JEL0407]|nr:hypothetical protein HK098_007805 [Nowakowskiella sp. JEL0407]
MALKLELETWQDGVKNFEKQNWNSALDVFEPIANSAKIRFNVAMILVNTGQIGDAIVWLDRAIALDNFFAVAYFQRGACFFSQDLIKEALDDFNKTLELMRNNQFIDYTQLGLDYKLFTFEILFNMGLCYSVFGDERSAYGCFQDALDQRPDDMKGDEKYRALDEAVRMNIREIADTLNAFMVPRDKCYKPPQDKMKNTGKIDFLGSSKVVAAVDENDDYTGFSGKALRETLGRTNTAKKPERTITQSRSQTLKDSSRSDRNQDSKDSNATSFITVTRSNSTRTPRNNTTRAPPRGEFEEEYRTPRSNPRPPAKSEFDDDYRLPRETTPASLSRPTIKPRTASMSRSRKNNNNTLPLPDKVDSRGRDPNEGSSRTRNMSEGRDPLRRAQRMDDGHMRSASDQTMYSREKQKDTNRSPMSPPEGPKIKVKVHSTDIRMVLLPYNATFEELKDRICTKFSVIDRSRVKLKYTDDEGGKVLLTDQEDMEVAFLCAGMEYGQPPTPGNDKLELWLTQ